MKEYCVNGNDKETDEQSDAARIKPYIININKSGEESIMNINNGNDDPPKENYNNENYKKTDEQRDAATTTSTRKRKREPKLETEH